MPSINEVNILGHLGSDPELRTTKGGSSVCNLSIATSYKPKDGDEQTEWHRIIIWGIQAENAAKYLKKGSLAHVKGRLQTRKWTDDKGIDRWSTEIVAFSVLFLDRKEGGSASRRDEPPPPDDADIPF